MMQNVHFTFQLLGDPRQRRHIWRWLVSLRQDYLFERRLPWLTFDALDFLNSLPLYRKKIFEYGSGGSTLFWLRKGAFCVSVEHDSSWYARVRALLPKTSNLDYRLCKPENIPQMIIRDPADPNGYASAGLKEFDFRKYACQIDEFDDGYFDIVLIDGRARPSCIKHSYKKINAGGYLILDNADETYYTAKTSGYLKNFGLKQFYGAGPCGFSLWQTNIYTRNMVDGEV